MIAKKEELINLSARAFVEASYKSIATLGQNPITRVGVIRLNPIVNSLIFISSILAKAGILGPKNTRLHIESKYIGVNTRPIAAMKIDTALNIDVNAS